MSDLHSILFNNQLDDNAKLERIRQMTQQPAQPTTFTAVIEDIPKPQMMEAQVVNLHDDYALGKTPTPVQEPVDYTNGVASMLRNVAKIRRQENNITSAEAHERGANIIEEYCKKKGGPLANAAEARRLTWIGPRMEAKIAEFLSKGVVADSLKPVSNQWNSWYQHLPVQKKQEINNSGVEDMYKRWGGQYQAPKPAVHVPFATALAQGACKMNAKHQYKRVLSELTEKTIPSLPITIPASTPVADMDHYDKEINELIRMMGDGTFFQQVNSPRRTHQDPQDMSEDESSESMPDLVDSDGNVVNDTPPTWVRYNGNWIKVGGPTYRMLVTGGATCLVTDRHYTHEEMNRFRRRGSDNESDNDSSSEEWIQAPPKRNRSNSVPPYNCTRETLTETTKYTYYPGTTQLSEIVVVNRETGSYTEMTYFRSGQSQAINTYNCDGDRHGQCREWWPSGQLKSTGEYSNGEFKSDSTSFTYFPNGNTQICDSHSPGSTFRVEYRDMPNKVRVSQGTLINGQYEGPVYFFSENDNVVEISQFTNGFREGHSVLFFDTPNRTKRSENWFQNGHVVSPTVEYDYYGNMIRMDMSTYTSPEMGGALPDDHVFKTFKPVQTMGPEIFQKLFDFPEQPVGCGVGFGNVFDQATQILQTPEFSNIVDNVTETVLKMFAPEQKEKTE